MLMLLFIFISREKMITVGWSPDKLMNSTS